VAGLNDRLFILNFVSQLAGYLCATVQSRGPNEWLSADHNNGELVDESVKWSDFRNITFLQDGSQVISTYNSSIWEECVHSNNKNLVCLESFGIKQVLEDYQVLERISLDSTSNKTVVWNLRENVYAWKKKFAEGLSTLPTQSKLELGNGEEGCSYISSELPQHVRQLAQRARQHVYDDLNSTTAKVGVFHVRRGDAKHQCDTSIEEIKKYLECSFANTSQFGKMGLLVMSDEINTTYRSQIRDMVNEFAHVTFYDLDEVIKYLLQYAIDFEHVPAGRMNNFYLFSVGKSMQALADFNLEKRRMMCCPVCTNVAKMLNSSSTPWSRRACS